MKRGRIQTVELHAEAPPKPDLGAPCNGCGICCAVEPCPVARLFLFQREGRCKALEWNDGNRRYACGMVTRPDLYSRLVPGAFRSAAGAFFSTRIAAGIGCDAEFEIG